MDVANAFEERRKSIKRRGASLELVPAKDMGDGRERARERIDVVISFRIDGSRANIRVYIWDDRWIWIDARRSAKSGWAWQFTSEGRFLPIHDARMLVALTEKTLSAGYLSEGNVATALSELWQRFLASGPRPVF